MNSFGSFRNTNYSALKIAFMVLGFIIFLMPKNGFTQEEVNYVTLYDKGWDVSYWENVKYRGDIFTETRYGFSDLFDPFDPILICQVDNPQNCTLPPESPYTFQTLVARSYPGYSAFKVYIPPGNISFGFKGYVPELPDCVGIAVRFGMEPQGDYSPLKSVDEYIWASDTDNFISEPYQFFDQDVLIKNRTAYISFNLEGAPPGGGWLYFRVLKLTRNGYIKNFDSTMRVDIPTYADWFDTAEFDSAGNPTGGIDFGFDFDDLDENESGKIEMSDAILKLQRNKPQAEIDRILEILSGQ